MIASQDIFQFPEPKFLRLSSTAVNVTLLLIGVGKSFGPPRPPNRTGGFPAYGSPVGGFLIGNVSRSAKLFPVRAAQPARRMRWASVDGRLARARRRSAFPVCAGARAAVYESSHR